MKLLQRSKSKLVKKNTLKHLAFCLKRWLTHDRRYAAALRFQPTKRPQLQSQKQKPKTAFPKPAFPTTSSSSPDPAAKAAAQTAAPPVKRSIADWTADDEDVNGFYGGEKRGRGGRKKRKKNKEDAPLRQDWDDIYDPARPNNYEEYKHSEERIREIREWKDRLYAHRRRHTTDFSSSEEDRPPARTSGMKDSSPTIVDANCIAQFAPPATYNFAPPPPQDEPSEPSPAPVIPRPPPVDIDMDESGEDVFMRRMRMSQMQQDAPPPPPPPPPPPTVEPAPPPAQPSAPKQPLSALAAMNSTISRAPVRYNLPAAPADIPSSEAELERALENDESAPPPPPGAAENKDVSDAEEDAPRSNRPGQKGFAQRLMAKYGYTKGSGLGAQGTGITTALQVKVEKQKKWPDSEGGGFVDRGGKGKIIGGKKKQSAEEEEGKFGAMSEVIVLRNMLGGMDVEAEMQGGLVEEIGEECGDKYGRVERVYVWRGGDSWEEGPPVFVKFTSQLSGLRVRSTTRIIKRQAY